MEITEDEVFEMSNKVGLKKMKGNYHKDLIVAIYKQ